MVTGGFVAFGGGVADRAFCDTEGGFRCDYAWEYDAGFNADNRMRICFPDVFAQSMVPSVVHVFLRSTPLEVISAVVQLVSVDVVDLGLVVWVWDERLCYGTVNLYVNLVAVPNIKGDMQIPPVYIWAA